MVYLKSETNTMQAENIYRSKELAGSNAFVERIARHFVHICFRLREDGIALFFAHYCFTRNFLYPEFIRLFPFWKVFALFYVPFDKREPAAEYFKLHKLLYFIRGIGYPTPTGSRRVGVG